MVKIDLKKSMSNLINFDSIRKDNITLLLLLPIYKRLKMIIFNYVRNLPKL